MDLAELLGKRAKQWPGYVQVASLVTVFMALVIHKPEKEFALWQTAVVLVLAASFYLLGSKLDAVVFAPLYGLKPVNPLKRGWRFMARGLFSPIKLVVDQLPGTYEMTDWRKAAAETLRGKIAGSKFTCSDEDKDCEGVYNSAKALFERSDEWDDNVKPWLEISKAIRSFIWPLAIILVYDVGLDHWHIPWLDDLLSVPVLNWLSRWGVSLAALFLALVLYLWLRIFHMRALYKLVNNSEYILFPIKCDRGAEYRTALLARHLAIGEIGKQRKDKPVFVLIPT
jgi:hypothetical protein